MLAEARTAAVNENEARAAAGLTLVIGAVAFSFAYFDRRYVPLQIAASVFFADFLLRVTAGLRHSPVGLLARALAAARPAEWVPSRPKRFAWTLGLVMAGAMTAITNSGVRGALPRTMCVICLALMWMEAALGLCLGCKVHGLLARRGWTTALDPCADGACDLRGQRAGERVAAAADHRLPVREQQMLDRELQQR
jgi:Domain of unknown function (DUF4395)